MAQPPQQAERRPESGRPVRKQVHGWFPSLKLGRRVAFQSTLARDYLYLLDYDPAVTAFHERPLTLAYQDAGKLVSYTPDFAVYEGGHAVLVACLAERFRQTARAARLIAAAQDWCAEHHCTFRIVTAPQLQQGWRLANVKLLTYSARVAVPPPVAARIYACLAAAGGALPFLALLAALDPQRPRTAQAAVLHLIFHQRLRVPLDRAPLQDSTLVSLAPTISVGGLDDAHAEL